MVARVLSSAFAALAALVLVAICSACTTHSATGAAGPAGTARSTAPADSASGGGSTPQVVPATNTPGTSGSTTSSSGALGNNGSTPSYTSVHEPSGFTFDVRIAQAPTLSTQQGDGSNSNYPSAPPGQDWVLVTADIHNPLSDRTVPLADLLSAFGAIPNNHSYSVGIALPSSESGQVTGQCLVPAQLQAVASGSPPGYCYLLANINLPDGTFFEPVFGGAPTIPAGGNVIINLYAGPVRAGTNLSGVKIWINNKSSWTLVPSP